MMIAAAVMLLALILAFNLPILYQCAGLAAAESSTEVTAGSERACIKPVQAVIIICGGVMPIWLKMHDPLLTVFVLLLGCAAYIDLITRWVPDVLIYALSWVAFIALLPGRHETVYVLASAAMMLVPAALMNILTWLSSKKIAFASGDLYILPCVGLWLEPELSGLSMAICLTLTIVANRYIKEIPFITVLYPVFVGVMLCAG